MMPSPYLKEEVLMLLKVFANSINTPYMRCHNYIFMIMA